MRIKHPTERAAIYKQKGSNKWYIEYYVKINGKNVRKQKSAGTEDKEVALRELDKALLVADYIEQGKIDLKESNNTTVSRIVKKVIKSLEPKLHEKTIYKDYIRKLGDISEALGKTNIKSIDNLTLKSYFDSKMSQTQLIITKKAFTLIFEYAQDHKYIESFPRFPKVEIKKVEEREAIPESTIYFLVKFFTALSQSSKSSIARENFKLLSYFIILLYQTGMRYGELRHLKNKNIDLDNENILIDKSKVGVSRQIKISSESRPFFDFLKTDREYLFSREDLKLPDFSQVFKQAKERYIDTWQEYQADKYTLYNIRHSFINKKLLEERNLFFVAMHCGTSIKMIEKYYADLLIAKDKSLIFEKEEDKMDMWADGLLTQIHLMGRSAEESEDISGMEDEDTIEFIAFDDSEFD